VSSKAEKDRSALRYTGDLDAKLDGLREQSFYDAGRTTKISTDSLILKSSHIRDEVKVEIEHAINRERMDMRTALAQVQDLRLKAANATSPLMATAYTNQANTLAAKAESEHSHVRIKPDGSVHHQTLEKGWRHHGQVEPKLLAEMQRDAARYVAKPEPVVHAKPADDRLVVVNEEGKLRLLGPKTVEQLKDSLHGELTKAGHTGALPDKDEVKKMAAAVANAHPGEHIAVTDAGKHHVVPKGAPHPTGATVLEAGALRESAKIAESALVRKLAGPEMSVLDGAMAATTFFDNASGHALSAGVVGRALGSAGESSGAFGAIMKAQETLEPVLAKAEKTLADAADKSGLTAFVGEQLAKAERLGHEIGADKVVAKVSEIAEAGVSKLESVIRENVHGPDNPVHRSAPAHEAGAVEPAARVQEQLHQSMLEAGKPGVKLTAEEGAHLARELANVQPGDHLVVEKNGEIYLALGPQEKGAPDFPKSATVFDADAMRENAGIASNLEMSQPKAQAAAPEARTPEMSMGAAA
jgi:hypothetical protein